MASMKRVFLQGVTPFDREADRRWGRRHWVRCWHPDLGWTKHSTHYHDGEV